ncbi:MAG: hypothetical protein IPK60_20360 [Sandaracinaceae bacterium]|nr:hypothetical protein [Sandaracinaceae bacterium]
MSYRPLVAIVFAIELFACGNQRRNNGVVPVDAGFDGAARVDMGGDVGRDAGPVRVDFGVGVDGGLDMGGRFDAGGVLENSFSACSDFVDNDGDSFVDCEDFNCCAVVSCELGTSCNPLDAGARVDSGAPFDAGRDAGASSLENTVSACSDGSDNDLDTYIDCDDFNCCSVVTCGSDSSCGMRDGGTFGDAGPSVESTVSACSDLIDNDTDSFVDCNDFNCCGVVECGTDSACGHMGDSCADTAVTLSVLGRHIIVGDISLFTTLGRAPCDAAGRDAYFMFRAPYTGSFTIDTGDSTFDTTLAVYGGVSGCAGADLYDCDDDGGPTSGSSSVTITAGAGQVFYVFIGAFYSSTTSGTFYVNIAN